MSTRRPQRRRPAPRPVTLTRREYDALRAAIVVVDAADLDGNDPKVITDPLRAVVRRWRDAYPDAEPATTPPPPEPEAAPQPATEPAAAPARVCESTRYAKGPCEADGPRWDVVTWTRARPDLPWKEALRHPACFRHGIAEVEGFASIVGSARCELVEPKP